MNDLTEDQKQVIILKFIERHTNQEVGEIMGVSRGTVWRLLQSGRTKIAQAFVEGRLIEIREHPE